MQAESGLVPLAAPAKDLRIGEAAALVGVSTRTLRYYEELGMVQPPQPAPEAYAAIRRAMSPAFCAYVNSNR